MELVGHCFEELMETPLGKCEAQTLGNPNMAIDR